MPTATEKRRAFRAMHEHGAFMLPNAWDAGSAVRLARMGFAAIASTSSGAAWAAGREDGELGRDAVLAHLRQLVGATALPVNADFENGFADAPEQVAANVALAVETGVAAVSLEDWAAGRFYDATLAAERIAAAREAIDRIDPATMLIGRFEHFRGPGTPLAEALSRLVSYARAGADCLFAPGIDDPGAIREMVAAVAPKPVSMLIGPFDDGRVAGMAALGVRRFSTGGGLAKAAWDGFDAAARAFHDQGAELAIPAA